jgi:hypothetical protein
MDNLGHKFVDGKCIYCKKSENPMTWSIPCSKDPNDNKAQNQVNAPVQNVPKTPASSSTPAYSAPSYNTNPAIERYSDAYLVAQTIVEIGDMVKKSAIGLFICILLAAFYSFTSDVKIFGLPLIIMAFAVAIPIYVLGILVSAQGQILKATLDTAVTNSPFLTKEEMAKTMSL